MNTRHTPAPWRRIIGRVGDGAAGSQHEQIQGANNAGCLLVMHDGSEEGNANAARAVACVNACEGVDDPAAALADLLDALRKAEAVLSQLQDNMTDGAALQAVMRQGYTGHALSRARSALARCGS